MPFNPVNHNDIVLLLIQLALLLLAARSLGAMCTHFGQPSVIGEIAAGILLGPTLFGDIAPMLGGWILPQTISQGHMLEAISLLGATLLMMMVGMETDPPLIRRHARTAISVSIGGILFTFSSGFILGQYLPNSLVVGDRLIFALFLATAMSISSIPVIAKVLMDLGLTRRDVGQTMIAAAMSDDTIGWIILSIVLSLHLENRISVEAIWHSVGVVIGTIIVSFTLGKWLLKKILNFVQDEIHLPHRLLTTIMILLFAFSAATHALHLEAVLGAFILGIMLGQMPRIPQEVHSTLEDITFGIFSPIFFSIAGLKVNLLSVFATPTLAIVTVSMIAVAIVSKMVGTYAGARLIGRKDHWTAISLGAGLNSRGAIQIIVGSIGFSIGILNQEMFSIIVLMAVVTSVLTPIALRWSLAHVAPEQQELKRLEQEEIVSKSVVSSIRRVLVPVRPSLSGIRTIQKIQAKLLATLNARTPHSVTLFAVVPPAESATTATYLNDVSKVFTSHETVKKVVEDNEFADHVLDEAQKHYDLMLLGATQPSANSLQAINPTVDYLIRTSPCPSLLIQSDKQREDWDFKRILVPIDGSAASKHAADLAYFLSDPETNHHVILLHVIPSTIKRWIWQSHFGQHVTFSHDMIKEIQKKGSSMGISTEGLVQTGSAIEKVIVKTATDYSADLILLGTNLRVGSDRLFLGPKIEHILKRSPCPVALFNGN